MFMYIYIYIYIYICMHINEIKQSNLNKTKMMIVQCKINKIQIMQIT